MISFSLLLFCLQVNIPQIFAFQPSSTDASSPASKNAPHIFNAIHSSLRQWGSSLNHNGMSFFVAHMPEGTELYHGRGSKEPVVGLEWLAFEPEHALNFAWNMSRPRQGRPPKDDTPRPEKPGHAYDQFQEYASEQLSTKWLIRSNASLMIEFLSSGTSSDPYAPAEEWRSFHDEAAQQPLEDKKPPSPPSRPPFERKPGYLHTYRARRDLTLLYIDGTSAGKSDKGTMDSQDEVLQIHNDNDGHPGDSPMMGEFGRAHYLCENLARDRWDGKVDGYIRMEHGFEIIMCDFEKSLRETGSLKGDAGEDRGTRGRNDIQTLGFWKAITARYNGLGGQGVGGGRAVLNFESMITGYEYVDAKELLDGKEGDEDRMPRLKNLPTKAKEDMFSAIDSFMGHYSNPSASRHINWQAVADLIVTRYSDRLYSLAYSSDFSNKDELDQDVQLLLRPFIDFESRNKSAEIERCATHFLPVTYPSSLAASSIRTTSYAVCETLMTALDVPTSSASAFEKSRKLFQDLVEYLQWTSWKECRGCAYDEVCMTAIWPFGTKEDHLRPSCKNGTEINNNNHGYWGGFGPPGRRRNDTDGRP